MAKDRPIEGMSLEELLEERDKLAAQRTELRLRQVAVQEAITMAEALKGLPESLRRRIRIEGALGSAGQADQTPGGIN